MIGDTIEEIDGEQYRPVKNDGNKNCCDVCDLKLGNCRGVCGKYEYNFGNFVVMKRIPKVVSKGKINVGDLELTLLVLDNGQRVIPKDDMRKALQFLGITEKEVDDLLRGK